MLAAVLVTAPVIALSSPAAPGPADSVVKLPPKAAAKAQRRVALVVGNAHYTGVPELYNSINDSADMCATLRVLDFETVCVKDIPTLPEFKARVAEFRGKLGPGAVGLFYYAGHGVEVDGDNYLLPTGAQVQRREDVSGEALSMREVMNTLAEARTDFNLVILDACRNNPFTQALGPRPVYRGITPSPKDAPPGSMVVYATSANEQALDGFSGQRNSPFAKHLLSYMRKPGLPVEQVFNLVSLAVQEETRRTAGRAQRPALYRDFAGEFCFAGCQPGPDIQAPLFDPPVLPPVHAAPPPARLQQAPPPGLKNTEGVQVPINL